MKPGQHKTSLFTQLSVIMVVLLTVMSFMHIYHATQIEKRLLTRQLDTDIQSNIDSLASHAGQLILSESLDRLEESMLELIAVEQITDLKVVSDSGMVLAHVVQTDGQQYLPRYDVMEIPLLKNINTDKEWKIIDDDHFTYGHPVITSNIIGWIIAEGNSQSLRSLYRDIFINNLVWTTAIIFFVIVIMIIFYKRITKSLYEVVRFSEHIITSPGDQFLPPSGSKEIYQLTEALNKSSIQLLLQKNEIDAQQKELRFKAGHDTLTGLPNRSLLMDRLVQAIQSNKRNNTDIALLFLDLNKFKPVNDKYGHDTGDALLKQVTHRLLACIRTSDTVARFGGDEFVILLSDVRQTDFLKKIVQKIKREIARPFSIDSCEITISVSIGTALFSECCTTAEELIEYADQQMYKDKNTP